MGDQDSAARKAGVPSWQLKPSEEAVGANTQSSDSPVQEPLSRASLIDTARQFLQEDEIRSSPTDKQIAFLEEKGLENHEIESLLGLSRNAKATSSPSEQSKPPSHLVVHPSAISQPSVPSPQVPSTRDAPPIITYPEFLTNPTQPPPLITAKRLLTTLYFFGGLSALFYGTNNYLVTPMIASLTESRHNLAETAQVNLDKLIARLREVVSEQIDAFSEQPHKEVSDTDSDGDPTELFHRDVGVQTSLPASPDESQEISPISLTVLSEQTIRLTDLSRSIKEISDASTAEGTGAEDLATTIGVLRDYLDGLAYSPKAYKYENMNASSRATDESMDEIDKLKAQIRSVKGVLLSARSFPAGGGGVRTR